MALRGRGLLILGPSGAGKSRLALDLIALGAGLVADDAVELLRRGDQVSLRAPAPTRGMIEARGIGLLACPAVGEVPLALVVDLGTPEPARLPPVRHMTVMGVTQPLLWTPKGGHAASALLLFLTYGRRA